MSADGRFARAGELLNGALEVAPSARAAWLASRTAGDEALRAEVEALLAAHAGADERFLAPPAEPGRVGARIAGYTLLEHLGTGGMGSVYAAREEHPRRRVALKLVRSLPGAVRDARRLEREAHAMARLSHPDIARVFAAGTEPDPAGDLTWVAMELVEGARSLGEHCRAAALGRDERLEAFERLCAAVEHGHRHGVVHCDLKPENVLVGADGTLKVIDFGIARLVGGDEAEATRPRTRAGGITGSLATMSPEQARGAEGDVAADVYALGAVLYELLTDRRALALEGLPLGEALRRIQEEPPPSPRRWVPSLPRDLAAIALRALEKEPERRYASARELADDVRRFRTGAPVHARPSGLLRRCALFARRHRAAVAAGAVVLLVSATATVVSLRFAVAAVRAAGDERVARLHAERLAALQRSLFESARPQQALGRDLTVRELLDDARHASERALTDQPAALGELLGTVAQTYLEIGEYDTACELFERALALAPADAPPARRAALLSPLGQAHMARGELDRAAARLGEARALLEPDAPSPHVASPHVASPHVASPHVASPHVASDVALRVLTRVREAELARLTGRGAEGRRILAAARAELESRASPEPLLLARVLDQLGELARGEGDYAGAVELHRASLALLRPRMPPRHPSVAATENALANALFEVGEAAEAEALWRSALETFEAVLDPEHPDLATVLANLALVHQRRREFPEAHALLGRAVELRRAALGPTHPRVIALLRRESDIHLAAGEVPRAVAVAAEVVELERELARRGTDDSLGLEQALFSLALAERAAGALAAAAEHLAESLALQAVRLPSDHLDLAQGRTLLGALLLAEGRPAEAEAALRPALEVRRAKLGPAHWQTANAESLLGAALLDQEHVVEAAPLLQGSVRVLERALGADDYRTREARERADRLP